MIEIARIDLSSHDFSSLATILSFLSALQFILLSVFTLDSSQLKQLASRVYSRMQILRFTETQLSERCSLAALHLFDDRTAPALSRDRIAKILMNRHEMPARSAARLVTYPELKVLASALQVSTEWLAGQRENRDPVVWNVLAQPDRFQSIANLVQGYEENSEQTIIWSRHPAYPLVTEDFARAINQIHYGGKDLGNKALVEFYNTVARARRKWILRRNRPFAYVSIMLKSDLERIVTGQEKYSIISKTIIARNLQFMIDTLSNDALNMKLVIGQDGRAADSLRAFESVATTDNLFSFWSYRNGDLGWSEHQCYTEVHDRILNELIRTALYTDRAETVEFLKSLKG